jgi:hypothetical protein
MRECGKGNADASIFSGFGLNWAPEPDLLLFQDVQFLAVRGAHPAEGRRSDCRPAGESDECGDLTNRDLFGV